MLEGKEIKTIYLYQFLCNHLFLNQFYSESNLKKKQTAIEESFHKPHVKYTTRSDPAR